MVVLSGGQDSFVTALLAREECESVQAVTFRYGQRHYSETEAAIKIAKHLAMRLVYLDLSAFGSVAYSALLDDGSDINEQHHLARDLPASFVPGRNLTFLAVASALAFDLGCTELWAGFCEADSSGYPDCRREFVASAETTIRLSLGRPEFRLVAPLLDRSKADIFAIAERFKQLPELLLLTRTCYTNSSQNNAWGFGCGACPACKLRRAGWETFQQRKMAIHE